MQDIKKLLEPHFGHLDFLTKIKSEDVSISDIEELVKLLNKKNIVANLPKSLHSYNSYYVLMCDLFYTNEKHKLNKFIKENIASESKKIFLDYIQNGDFDKLINIIDDDVMTNILLRWSSRIKTSDSLIIFLDSIIREANILKHLDDEKLNIIELKNYHKQKNLLPAAWCLNNSEDVFNNYIENQRIFILRHNMLIYGINCKKDLSEISSINDQSNKTVDLNSDIYNIAKLEIFKINALKIELTDSIENKHYSVPEKYSGYMLSKPFVMPLDLGSTLDDRNWNYGAETKVPWWQLEINISRISNKLLNRCKILLMKN